jgi:hypothetical protein
MSKNKLLFHLISIIFILAIILGVGILSAVFLFFDIGNLNRENYKVIQYSDISIYDPYITRKQFIPLPDRKGLFVRFKEVCRQPVMEMVAAPGAYTISFYRFGLKITSMEVDVDSSNRVVIDVYDTVYHSGYNGLAVVPLSGKNHYVAYIGLLENHTQVVIKNPVSPRKFTGQTLGNPDPNTSQHDITGVIGYLDRDDGEFIYLQAQSISELDVELLAIVTNKGKKIASFPEQTVIETIVTSPRYLVPVAARIASEGRKEYERSRLYLEYRYVDSPAKKTSKINPFTPYDDSVHFGTEIRTLDNLDKFPFVKLDNGTVTFEGAQITLDRMLFVPPEKRLVLNAGQTIDLRNGASLVCRSAIEVNGTEDSPVRLVSTDSTGHGLVVLGGKERSKVNYLVCDNLGEVHSGIYALTGAVTFYESDVDFYGCSFLNNRSEDGLNLVRSDSSIVKCIFSGTYQDAFDSDFCTGYFEDCYFELTGNDALDISTSNFRVLNCKFKDIHDKALSIGEASTAYIENIDVENAQIVVGAKDSSTVTGKNIKGKNTFIGYAAYQKKPEFGHSRGELENFILAGRQDFDYLIEKDEVLVLNGKQKHPRSKNKEAIIIDRLINEIPIL